MDPVDPEPEPKSNPDGIAIAYPSLYLAVSRILVTPFINSFPGVSSKSAIVSNRVFDWLDCGRIVRGIYVAHGEKYHS